MILADSSGLPGLNSVGVWLNDPDNWWGPNGLVIRLREHVIYTGGKYDSHLLIPIIPSAS